MTIWKAYKIHGSLCASLRVCVDFFFTAAEVLALFLTESFMQATLWPGCIFFPTGFNYFPVVSKVWDLLHNPNCTELKSLYLSPGCKKDGTLLQSLTGLQRAQNRTKSKTNMQHVLRGFSVRDYPLQIAIWATDGQWDSSVPRVIILESKMVEWNNSC